MRENLGDNRIEAHQVHLWVVPLPGEGCDQQQFRRLLSRREIERADRLRIPNRQVEFVASRAALRQILASYVEAAPLSLEFSGNSRDKPYVAGRHAGALEFSLSRTEALAVIGVAQRLPLGVDVERIRAMRDLDQFARFILTPSELEHLDGADDCGRLAMLFRFWTCKEAYLKGVGVGLSNAPKSVEVGWDADGRPQVLSALAAEFGRWQFFTPAAPEGYIATVAVRPDQQPVELTVRDWPSVPA